MLQRDLCCSPLALIREWDKHEQLAQRERNEAHNLHFVPIVSSLHHKLKDEANQSEKESHDIQLEKGQHMHAMVGVSGGQRGLEWEWWVSV